jgi:hypothetical protein
MEYRFRAEEWQSLSAENRAKRCRLLAEEARVLASGAPQHLAPSYLRIADDWTALAIEIEQAATVSSQAR